MGKWRYGVILDAGSSGTRVHIYRWLDPTRARKAAGPKELKSLPKIQSREEWTKKIHPGVSTFADTPDKVGPDHLKSVLQHALDIVPKKAVKETPVFLSATAGMRLLDNPKQEVLLDGICSYIRSNSNFLLPDCRTQIRVISGRTEGIYGWISTNYLLRSFDSPEEHDHGKGHYTYGFLDMGGASAQIAFSPNVTEAEKHANDLKLVRLRNIDGSPQEYKVFVTTWLQFGVHESRNRYVKALQNTNSASNSKELLDPCLPQALRTTLDGKTLSSEKAPEIYLVGTGRFDECLRQTYPLLEKETPCPDEPCLLHGIHVPAIDFDVNHFIGISEYWHTTHEIFEMGHKEKVYALGTYQERVNEFCSQDWATIEKGISEHKWGKKVDQQTASGVCFKASWIINMLHNGIGIPYTGPEHTTAASPNDTIHHSKNTEFLNPFQAVNKIGSNEVSWTLGQMVLYASFQVPPASKDILPVGFGSNTEGIPDDFQYPSVEPSPMYDGGHWHDALFDGDPSRRIPGFLLFALIVVIAVFFLCGRNRRVRIYHNVKKQFMCGGSRRHKKRIFGRKLPFFGRSTPIYERVMEEGGRDFELDDTDKESVEYESEHLSDSDSSGMSPRVRTPSKGSISHNPNLKFEFENGSNAGIGLGINQASSTSSGNVVDRRGLAVRTESRDHLAALSLGPTMNGRRSRTVSPTRSHLRSPSMADSP
ncbi:GDA1/CD39 (nucleoside phosphatase) family domain containing protein [Elaphomyces granulatus]